MARKKSATPEEAPAPSPVAEDFAKDEPLHQPQEEVPAKPKTIDMVRAAIAAGKSMPKEGIAWIKETFDFDLKPGNFSVNKSTIERRDGKASAIEAAPKRAYTRRQPKEAAAPEVAATHTAPANGHMSPSAAARSVKELIDRLGVNEVKNLVELFGG